MQDAFPEHCGRRPRSLVSWPPGSQAGVPRGEEPGELPTAPRAGGALLPVSGEGGFLAVLRDTGSGRLSFLGCGVCTCCSLFDGSGLCPRRCSVPPLLPSGAPPTAVKASVVKFISVPGLLCVCSSSRELVSNILLVPSLVNELNLFFKIYFN